MESLRDYISNIFWTIKSILLKFNKILFIDFQSKYFDMKDNLLLHISNFKIILKRSFELVTGSII